MGTKIEIPIRDHIHLRLGHVDLPLSGLLPDHEIRKLCTGNSAKMELSDILPERAMIFPFVEGEKRPGKISYGLSHAGYDIRLGHRFKIFTPTLCQVVDPKAVDEKAFMNVDLTDGIVRADYILIPPNSYALAESLETFNIPNDTLAICLGKSTLARCSLIVNMTPLEPGWKGRLTIEISNSCQLPVKLYPGEGVAQLLFFRLMSPPEQTYNSKEGRYQNQEGLQTARVD